MGFRDWLGDVFRRQQRGDHDQTSFDTLCIDLSEKILVRDLAINTTINLLGNAISLSDFNTYKKGNEDKSDIYYKLNVEPNPNYSASRFWKKFVYRLVYDGEVLIIKQRDDYYIADSFVKEVRAFYTCKYRDVVVDNFSLKRSYDESDVLYFKLHERNIVNIVGALYDDYGKLVEYSKASYKKNNAKRGIVNIPTNYPQTEAAKAKLNKLLNDQIQKFYGAENGAVLPLTNGITYEDISSDSYKNSTDSRDIRNLIDDIFDFTAIGFNIPPALLKGSANDLESTVDRFIKFGVEPFCEMIEDEINRKFYSKNAYLNNTYMAIDTSRLKTTNLAQLANVVDVLTRNGVNNIDENRKLLGMEPLRTEESQKRRITKNYEASEEI
jgi:phage portal protein, HK97 family|nr:MAG TPA: portal protein [Caudoviricetes sp.]